jgi:hypothetical protein
MDWEAIVKTLGSTAVVIAALSFLAKGIINQVLKRDLEAHKAALKQDSDAAKARLESELKQTTDTALLAQKNVFEREMETFKVQLAGRATRDDRIRAEVVKWANPILTAVEELQRRLKNILQHEGYLLLSKGSPQAVSGWSAQYDYFLPSTIYLFCQYFCWVRLLEEKLSFEMFEKQDVKDVFFNHVRTAGDKLSRFPLEEMKDLQGGSDDRQVFALQQRVLGEIVAISQDGDPRCMRYAEFLDKYEDVTFGKRLTPMIKFIDGISPDHHWRWKRLDLLSVELDKFDAECRRLLKI